MPETFPAITAEVIDHSSPDAHNGLPFGTYTIKVQVFDKDGKLVTLASDTAVHMDAPDNLAGAETDAYIDTRASLQDPSTYHSFQYSPQVAGAKTLTFTSGDLSVPLSIVVA
jgi:hypothetical protein